MFFWSNFNYNNMTKEYYMYLPNQNKCHKKTTVATVPKENDSHQPVTDRVAL